MDSVSLPTHGTTFCDCDFHAYLTPLAAKDPPRFGPLSPALATRELFGNLPRLRSVWDRAASMILYKIDSEIVVQSNIS